jgi:hypothetical protein
MSERHSDLGPRVRLRRGDVVVEVLAKGTAGGETKRARVCDPLTAIMAAGGLGNADDAARRMRAAETLRDMTDLAAGLRGEPSEKVDGGGGGLFRQEVAFAAKRNLARVWIALDAGDKPVVRWVVLGYGSIAGYVATARCRRATAADQLRNGLDRISEVA